MIASVESSMCPLNLSRQTTRGHGSERSNPRHRCTWTRRVAGLYAHGETDKARTLRTKHGPLGCEGKKIAAGQPRAIAFYKTHTAEATSCSASPQEALSPTAERSVLCPQCPRFVRVFISVETRTSWVLH